MISLSFCNTVKIQQHFICLLSIMFLLWTTDDSLSTFPIDLLFFSQSVLCLEILLSEIHCTYFLLVCYLSFTFACGVLITLMLLICIPYDLSLFLCGFYVMFLLQKGISCFNMILEICCLFFSFGCLTFVSLIHVELHYFLKEQSSDLTYCFFLDDNLFSQYHLLNHLFSMTHLISLI